MAMTRQEQLELLKLIRSNLVHVLTDFKYKFNDVDFTDKMRTVIDQMDISIREFETDCLQSATQIAIQYMKGNPDAGVNSVSNFVVQTMKAIKSI